MANSCVALTGSGPAALGLDLLFGSKALSPDNGVLDEPGFPKCDHNILIG